MWRDDFEQARLPEGALADGAQVVVGRRPGLLPRVAHGVPVVLLRGHRPAASRARATCSPSSRRCGARWPPRACSSPRSGCTRPALPRTIGVVTGEGGKARDDVLAGLHRRGWAGRAGLGLRPGPGPPRRAGDHPRAAGPRGGRGGRRHRRRARRRLARRPVRVLRRDAVPHGRAAARAGHRVGRPPHRPHADRRRRRGALLDADARRRDRGAAALGEARAPCGAQRRAPGRTTGAARSSSAPATSRSSSRAPADARRAPPRALHQQLREMRASAAAARRRRAQPPGTQRARAHAARPRPPRAPDVAARARGSRRSPPRWPPTTPSASSSAATPSSTTATATSSRSAAEARAAGRVRPVVLRRRRVNARIEEMTEQHADPSAPTRPPPRAWRRSSGAWTPARPGCARRSSSCKEGRGLVEFCAAELDAVGRGLEELRLDELVARLRPSAPQRAPQSRASLWDRVADLPLTIEDYALERLERDVSSAFTRVSTLIPLHGGGTEGIGEDVTYDADDQDALQAAGPDAAARRRLDAGALLRPPRDASTSGPQPPQREASRLYRHLGLRVGGAGPRAAPGGRAAARGPRARAAARAFVVSLRLGEPAERRAAAPAPGSATRRCASSSTPRRLGRRARRRARRHRRGRLASTSRASTRARSSTARRPRPLRAGPRALPGRLDRGSRTTTPEIDALLEAHSDRITWDANIHSVADIEALPFAPQMVNVKPSRLGRAARAVRRLRLLRAPRHRHVRRRAVRARRRAAGTSSTSRRSSTPTRPTTSLPAATTTPLARRPAPEPAARRRSPRPDFAGDEQGLAVLVRRRGPLRRPRRDAPPQQRRVPALLRDRADRLPAHLVPSTTRPTPTGDWADLRRVPHRLPRARRFYEDRSRSTSAPPPAPLELPPRLLRWSRGGPRCWPRAGAPWSATTTPPDAIGPARHAA